RLGHLFSRPVEPRPCLRDLRIRLLLELRGPLHRRHEVRNQVVPVGQLNLDVRLELLRPLIQGLDLVVSASPEGRGREQKDDRDAALHWRSPVTTVQRFVTSRARCNYFTATSVNR